MNNQYEENFYYSDQHYLTDIELIEKLNKEKVKVDDVKLKMMSCSHIEQAKYIANNGNVQVCCKACGLWDSESI